MGREEGGEKHGVEGLVEGGVGAVFKIPFSVGISGYRRTGTGTAGQVVSLGGNAHHLD